MFDIFTENSYSTLLHYHVCLIYIIYTNKLASERQSSPSTPWPARQARPPLLLGPPCMSHPMLLCPADRHDSTLVLPPSILSRKRRKKKRMFFFLADGFLPQSTPRLATCAHASPQPLGVAATAGKLPRYPRPGPLLVWGETLTLLRLPPQPAVL